MRKKGVKEIVISDKKINSSKKISSKQNSFETEKILVENFVALQKVLTNLSFKFDALSNQISKLLELFEISAKSLASKNFEPEKQHQEILKKLDNLTEQNKVFARGIALVHEKPQPSQFQYSPSQIKYTKEETPKKFSDFPKE